MSIAIITHGFPASGKTTWAIKWRAEDPAHRVIICRDDIRREWDFLPGVPEHEKAVTRIHTELVKRAVFDGKDMVIANTALKLRDAVQSVKPAAEAGYDIRVESFIVDYDELLVRNAKRTGVARVPDDVMHSMFSRQPYENWWTPEDLKERLNR